MFKNLLFCGWTTAKLTTLKHFGFIFNYSGFLVNNTSIFNGCVITVSFMLPTFICFSFHNFYFGNFNMVFQNQTIITILVVPMLTNHNNVPFGYCSIVLRYTWIVTELSNDLRLGILGNLKISRKCQNFLELLPSA